MLFGGVFLLGTSSMLGLLRKVILLLKILDPRMVKHFDQWKPFIRLVNQYLIHQILVLIRQSRLEPDLPSHDLVANLSGMDASERSTAVDQLVEEDTE